MSATNARLKAAEELLGSHGWPQASGNQAVVEIYLAALQQEAPSRPSKFSDPIRHCIPTPPSWGPSPEQRGPPSSHSPSSTANYTSPPRVGHPARQWSA